MADVKKIEAGRNWLVDLNNDIDALGLKMEVITDGITFLNGWRADGAVKIVRIKLQGIGNLCFFQFHIAKNATAAETGDFARIPDELTPGINYFPGGEIPVKAGGHLAGYVSIYTLSKGKLGYQFIGDINDAGKSDITGEATLVYVI